MKDKTTGIAAVLSSLNVSIRKAFTRSEAEPLMEEFRTLREALSQQGILMYSPYRVGLE